MKKLLVIGGTQFVGRNLMEALIEDGRFELTMFNRGITNPDLFPDVKLIKGDRKVKNDVAQFTGQYWDYIIDISGYWPAALEQQLEMQKGNVGRYIYLSTCSHYDFDEENPHLVHEEENLVACSPEQKVSEEQTLYNEHKAECERVLQAQQELDFIILRPGLIIGKYDHTDRLYYWFHRVQTQDKILVPHSLDVKICYSDVNDLARMLIQSIEIESEFNVFNASSYLASISDMINVTSKLLNKKPELIKADKEFLEHNKVAQWTSLPFYLESEFLIVDNARLKEVYEFNYSTIQQTAVKLVDYYSNFQKWIEPNEKTKPLTPLEEEKLIEVLDNVEVN